MSNTGTIIIFKHPHDNFFDSVKKEKKKVRYMKHMSLEVQSLPLRLKHQAF